MPAAQCRVGFASRDASFSDQNRTESAGKALKRILQNSVLRHVTQPLRKITSRGDSNVVPLLNPLH